MNKQTQHRLPASGEARETLRAKGQFWTPEWIAEAMVAYVLDRESDSNDLFDPAVGAGAFLLAAKKWARRTGKVVALAGTEVDPVTLQEAERVGLSSRDIAGVVIQDFVRNPPQKTFNAIVANPPYLRHHRLAPELKKHLKEYSSRLIGKPIDGRAGLHVYFLLLALERLAPNGRLAFVVPADICEGIFAPMLWQWIARRFCLDAVITFTAQASPFPGVDTNALILLIRNSVPEQSFFWVQIAEAETPALREWVESGFFEKSNSPIRIYRRELSEALSTGLSRPPRSKANEPYSGLVLGDFASVVRGVATGANEFFFLTQQQARERNLPEEFLLRAVGRTRDVPGDIIDSSLLEALERSQRPTMLLALDGRPLANLCDSLRAYLKTGEELGLPEKSLIGQRRPWYKMEKRDPPPPFLFAYLGRRNARFILNEARVVPLTGFLCVYPKQDSADFHRKLWEILRHSSTVEGLAEVGKSYGSGAIKVEPRALERLPLSEELVESVGFSAPRLLLETPTDYE